MIEIFKKWNFQEQDQLFLWIPVSFATGVAIYFSLLHEPNPHLVFLGLFFSCFLTVLVQKTSLFYPFLYVVFLFLGGVSALWRTHSLEVNMLEKPWDGFVKATIESVEPMPGQTRMWLKDATSKTHKFQRIRVNFKHKKNVDIPTLQKKFHPGVRISFFTKLMPPPPVETPGLYDFRFFSYFQRLEAVGFAGLSKVEIKTEYPAPFFNKLRHFIGQEIRRVLPDQSGEIAAALIIGDRSGITTEIRDSFIRSGIAHILAISGLHLSLVAGLLFFIFRRMFTLSTYLALHFPLKKIAAVCVIFGIYFYLRLSGEAVPVMRAFIMTSLVLMGVLLDRNPVSLRSVGIAAVVILSIQPEALLGASFQLSFAAVIALVGFYEVFLKSSALQRHTLKYGKVYTYVLGTLVTSLIASLATMPYVMYIFNRISWHSIEANLLVIPLMAFWIMPWALAAVVLMPFGVSEWSFKCMAFGIKIMEKIAFWIASLPGSEVWVAQKDAWFLGVFTFGGLWFVIWRQKWRWVGVLGMFIAFIIPQDTPLAFVASEKKLFAVNIDGVLYTNQTRKNFITDQWRAMVGASHTSNIFKSKAKNIVFENNKHLIILGDLGIKIFIGDIVRLKYGKQISTEGGILWSSTKKRMSFQKTRELTWDRPWIFRRKAPLSN